MEFLEKLSRDAEFRATIFKDREEYIQFFEYMIHIHHKVVGKNPEILIVSPKLFSYIESIERRFSSYYQSNHQIEEQPSRTLRLSQGEFTLKVDPEEHFLRCE